MNLKRRKLLKLALFGSGAMLLGSLLTRAGLNENKKEYKNFNVVEDGDNLVFYAKSGKKVMTLSEDGTLEVGE